MEVELDFISCKKFNLNIVTKLKDKKSKKENQKKLILYNKTSGCTFIVTVFLSLFVQLFTVLPFNKIKQELV